MQASRSTIWLVPAPTEAARRSPPTLRGPVGTLDRVMQALRTVRDPDTGVDIVQAGWLRGLSIDADEAELNLLMPRVGCSAMHIVAEAAFAVLRHELPDTDLYLRPVQAG